MIYTPDPDSCFYKNDPGNSFTTRIKIQVFFYKQYLDPSFKSRIHIQAFEKTNPDPIYTRIRNSF